MELQELLQEIQVLSEQNKLDKPFIIQEIISKNFEVLRTVLQRINSLYQFNQDLEKSMMKIEMKINKMSQNQENIHYEMRVGQIALDSKLQNVAEKCNNISQMKSSKSKKQIQSFQKRQVNRLQSLENTNNELSQQSQRQKKQAAIQVSSLQQDQKDLGIKMRQQRLKKKQIKFKVERQQELYEQKQIKSEKSLPGQYKKNEIKEPSNLPRQKIIQKGLKDDYKCKTNKSTSNKNLNIENSDEGICSIRSEHQFNRKTNLKPNTNFIKQKAKYNTSLHFINEENNNPSHNHQPKKKLENILLEVETYNITNEKIRKNYEELMENYLKINQNNFSLAQNQIKELNSRVNQEKIANSDAINNLKAFFGTKFDEIANISSTLESKINLKTEKLQFYDFYDECNKRFQLLHEQRSKLAKKDETRRALEFLENKINQNYQSIAKNYNIQQQQSIHKLEVDKNGCFRIAEIQNESTLKDFNRQELNSLLQVSEDKSKILIPNHTKREASSLHARPMNGFSAENRFNQQIQRVNMSFSKRNKEEQGHNQRVLTSKSKQRQKLRWMSKKSSEILQRQKKKIKRVKKSPSGAIFEYDDK